MASDLKDLELLIDSKVPLLVIESYEEPRVLEMLTRLAIRKALSLYTWSVTEGICRLGFGNDAPSNEQNKNPTEALTTIKNAREASVYVLCDFHPYLRDEPVNVRLLREIAMRHQSLGHTIVLLSHKVDLPPEIKRYSARFELSMPTEEQLMNLVREEAVNWSKQHRGQPVRSDPETFSQLVKNLKGVSLQDARQLIRGVIYDDGAILESDLPEVNKAKFALMDMEAVLSFEYNTAHFSEVGGLSKLKRWLSERQKAWQHRKDGNIDMPKGIMLLGVQGGGKSLAAKAVAGMWNLPLLRLDFGALYNKFHGETERNLRDALKLADLMSPCVLWLDEIEKGISTSDNDQGTSARLLGTLLTWMAERKTAVFLVCTSNDISRLPPELIRKGRLDEIFFVDLPSPKVRADILKIHLNKRGEDANDFDIPLLTQLTEGFSGADIEQAIVSALYSSSSVEDNLTTEKLAREIKETSPLSIVMQEKIDKLRAWASERCVFAD